MPSPFDIAKAICTKEDSFVEKDYVPFMVNKILSMKDPETCVLVNTFLNITKDIPKQQQYIFLMAAVSKGNGYIKWLGKKKDKDDQKYSEKSMQAIIKVYGVRPDIAEQYLDEIDILDLGEIEKHAAEMVKAGM